MSARAFDLWLSVVVLTVTLRTFVFFPVRIPSASMVPTFRPGARLMVDRLTLNFRAPRPGDCVVFLSAAVPGGFPRAEGSILLKRLAGQAGDVLRLRDDRVLTINGREARLCGASFERLYARQQDGPVSDGVFLGHLNQSQVTLLGGPEGVAPRLADGKAEFRVRAGHVAVLGDYSYASLDSRRWGDIPVTALVGRVWEP